jgi:hypothetical protein
MHFLFPHVHCVLCSLHPTSYNEPNNISNQHAVIYFMLVSCLAYRSTLKMEATCRIALNELHFVISQKIELSITTAVRTSVLVPLTYVLPSVRYHISHVRVDKTTSKIVVLQTLLPIKT